jgi:hypothetical protein
MITTLREKKKVLIDGQYKSKQNAMEFKITYIAPFLHTDFSLDFIENQKKEITSVYNFKFRLLDGDRNTYFEGVACQNDSFDPLDFFGSEFGCTDLQYFENGKYVSL